MHVLNSKIKIIPLCFVFCCALIITGSTLVFLHGFDGCKNKSLVYPYHRMCFALLRITIN